MLRLGLISMSRDNPKPADITKNAEATTDVAKEEVAKEVTSEGLATELATKAASEATDTAEINIDPAPEKPPFDAKLFLKTVTARPGVYRICLLYTSPSPRDRG